MRIFSKSRGISIIGTMFTLIILGVMGAALVSIVATDQESRMAAISSAKAFYAVQAGFEYALREIKRGGYPIVAGKPLDSASFTVTIDPATNKVTVVGVSREASSRYTIVAPQLADDCAQFDVSGVSIGGPSNNVLSGVIVTHSCLDAVTVDKVVVEWGEGAGKYVRRINIGGVDVYSDPEGADSGEVIDIQDYTISVPSTTMLVEFNSSIMGKKIVITLRFTDSSQSNSPEI